MDTKEGFLKILRETVIASAIITSLIDAIIIGWRVVRCMAEETPFTEKIGIFAENFSILTFALFVGLTALFIIIAANHEAEKEKSGG